MAQRTLSKAIRLTHLYYGVFISPAILFFALTGALQTFDLHEPNRAGTYQPPKWLAVLGHLHKKADATMPQQRGPGGGAGGGAGRDKGPDRAGAPVSAPSADSAVRTGVTAESSNAAGVGDRRGQGGLKHRQEATADAPQIVPAPAAAAPLGAAGSSGQVNAGRTAPAGETRAGAATGATPRRHNTLPMKIFFVAVSLGLFVATGTGLYMSYTFTRNKRLVTLALVAGIVVPLLLTLF